MKNVAPPKRMRKKIPLAKKQTYISWTFSWNEKSHIHSEVLEQMSIANILQFLENTYILVLWVQGNMLWIENKVREGILP